MSPSAFSQRFVALLFVATVSAQSITLASSPPSDAGPPVDPHFPGFAFEEASWVRYASNGTGKEVGHANTFSYNLMNEVSSRTGTKPRIRIGGTSADYGYFSPGQSEPAIPIAEFNQGHATNETFISPAFWEVTKNFPDASYVIQIPLATQNKSEMLAWAKSMWATLGKNRIHAIEIGNEPDLYGKVHAANGKVLGPPQFRGVQTNASYAKIFSNAATEVSSALGIPANDRIFQAFDTATHHGSEISFIMDVKTGFNLGIDNSSHIKQVAHHFYGTPSGDDLRVLLDHNAIVTRFSFFKPFLSFLKSYKNGALPFVLSEVASSTNTGGNLTYQAGLGTALWHVDFQLQAMSVGVGAVNFQQIVAAGFRMWLPVETVGHKPQVYGHYYAMPFVADFIGKNNDTRVAPLHLTGNGDDKVIGYGAWSGGSLVRVALVDFHIWTPSVNSSALIPPDRPVKNITLNNLPSGTASVKATYLISNHGAKGLAESITYAGSQWTAKSGGKEVKGVRNDTKIVQVGNGKAVVKVPASSAVLIHMQ